MEPGARVDEVMVVAEGVAAWALGLFRYGFTVGRAEAACSALVGSVRPACPGNWAGHPYSTVGPQ